MIGIETKCIPASNTRPKRVVAFTCNGHRLTQPYDDGLNSVQAHFKVAQALIAAQLTDTPPHQTMTYGGTKRGYFFTWTQSTVTA